MKISADTIDSQRQAWAIPLFYHCICFINI